MKNSYTPYYNESDCCSEYRYDTYDFRPNGIFPGGSPAGYPTSSPAGTPPGFPPMSPTGSPAINQLQPITPTTEPQALSLTSTEYMNGYLRTQIGKMVRVEFLIGTGTLIDRTGTLLSVGANFITLRQVQTDDLIICDFYSIKFISVLL